MKDEILAHLHDIVHAGHAIKEFITRILPLFLLADNKPGQINRAGFLLVEHNKRFLVLAH